MFAGYAVGPRLNGRSGNLYRASAPAAHQVMVVHLAAAPIQGLAVIACQGVELAGFCQEPQIAVNGGQANAGALRPEVGVDLLGAAESILLRKEFAHGLPLARHS